MTTLREALETTPWRQLRAIGRRRGLRLSSNLRKAELVELLAQALPDPTNLAAALATLSQAQQDALADILAAGGRLPLRYLRSPDRDRDRDSDREKESRYRSSLSAPLELLRVLGLIFYDRTTDDVFIPDDLIPHLPTPVFPPPPTSAPAQGDLEPASWPAWRSQDGLVAAHDVTCLLALLQRDEVRLLHGRWLPPRWLAAWGERCALPPRHPQARSELQTDRRRFLHYLAEAAGLLGLAGSFLTQRALYPKGTLQTDAGRLGLAGRLAG